MKEGKIKRKRKKEEKRKRRKRENFENCEVFENVWRILKTKIFGKRVGEESKFE